MKRLGWNINPNFNPTEPGEEVPLGDGTLWGVFATPEAFPTENLRNNDVAFAISTMGTYQYSTGSSSWEIVQVQNVSDIGDLPTSDVREGAFTTVNNEPYMWNGFNWIPARTGIPLAPEDYDALPSGADNSALAITADTYDLYHKSDGTWKLILGAERANASTLPVTNVETDALILVDGKPFTYDGTKWENPIVDLTTWSSRPRNVPDGTWGVGPNGRVYRYFSSAGPGEWIDARVYASATYRAKIVGDVVPASETPAWTEAADGGGSISTDGTRVRLDGQGAGVGARAFAWFNHGQSGASVGLYVCGYMTASGTLTGQGVSIWGENGVRAYQAGTGNATGNGWLLFPNLTGTAATAGEVITSGSERWVELVADANGAQLWVDHKLVGWRQAAFFDAVALTRFLIGEISSSVTRGILDVRDVACFTYTI